MAADAEAGGRMVRGLTETLRMAGFRKRRAARRKKYGIVGDLPCQFGETGFRDMAFQLIDHNGGGAEQMVTHGAGRLALVTFDLSIPPF